MNKPTILDLFSGIGGFSLAGHWAGFETVAFCEREPFCQKVLAKHWPEVPIFDDICRLTADALRQRGVEHVDVITGGFPCQDISPAGKRAGITGDRSGLWREYFRLIRELRPSHVVIENSSALLLRQRDGIIPAEIVLSDLASIGMDAEWSVLYAADVGAPHYRGRCFMVAYNPCVRSWRRGGVCRQRLGFTRDELATVGTAFS